METQPWLGQPWPEETVNAGLWDETVFPCSLPVNAPHILRVPRGCRTYTQ